MNYNRLRIRWTCDCNKMLQWTIQLTNVFFFFLSFPLTFSGWICQFSSRCNNIRFAITQWIYSFYIAWCGVSHYSCFVCPQSGLIYYLPWLPLPSEVVKMNMWAVFFPFGLGWTGLERTMWLHEVHKLVFMSISPSHSHSFSFITFIQIQYSILITKS